MEKKLRLGNLYEFYGELLTDKQKEILDVYCNDDLSLGEISDNHGVSRQAIYDTIKRSERLLEDFEAKLGLYEKFSERQHIVEEAHRELNAVLGGVDGSQSIETIKAEVERVIQILGQISES